MLKVDTGRLREPAAWTMLAVVITTVLVSIARMLIGSSLSSTFGVRAAASLYSLVSPVSTALTFGAVLLVAKAGAPTPRARLVALGAAGSLGLGIVFGLIAVLGVLVGDLATFRDRFEHLITGLPMIALAVIGALFALSTASALQPVREPAGDYFGRREDAYPPQSYAPALPQNPQGPQGPQGPQAPQGYGEVPVSAGAGVPAHAPSPGPMPAQQVPAQQVPAQQQFGHPAPGDPQNVPQTPPQNVPHPGQYDAPHQGQSQGQSQGQPQGPAYGQSAPAPVHPQLPPAEHRYAEHQQYAQDQYAQDQYGQDRGQGAFGQERPQDVYGQEYEPQPSYAPAPTAPQPPPFGQPGAPAPAPASAPVSSQGPGHGQAQQQPGPSLHDVQTGAHYSDYGPYGAQPEAAAPQRPDYSPPPQGPVFDQYGYAGQQTDSGGYGQFPSAPPAAPNAPGAPDPRGYGQHSSYSPAPEARPYEQEQPYGQGSPFSGYSGQAFARQAAEHTAGGPAFDAPPAYEGPADPREQQLAQAYQQAQSYQKGALPDHPTGPQDMPEYYDNPLGHPQSEPAPFQPPVPGPADQTLRFDPSGYQGDPLSDPLRREEPLDPTAIYTPDRSQAKYEEGSAPDQAGLGTDPNLPWYGSER
ncbi:hypothetical protein [Microbispora sp. KK1-11]|uniref:hypothetical protein n=1 Tax=Microbispora sp. KK1-11 TaxID=2053005 RepID=UPI001157B0DB|nr:hypothetical protein [Microbispora sp. KK1-11]TQS27364.1 hypothetical protein FLW16_19655 [Microbispora sp. KK1-11]